MSTTALQTETLARLYLAQGHHAAAREIADALAPDEAQRVQAELARVTEEKVLKLEALLRQIQARRRPAADARTR